MGLNPPSPEECRGFLRFRRAVGMMNVCDLMAAGQAQSQVKSPDPIA